LKKATDKESESVCVIMKLSSVWCWRNADRCDKW